MFQRNTLFILGAGASCNYGFPLGQDLVHAIVNDMEDEILIPIYVGGKQSPPYWNKNDDNEEIVYSFLEIKKIILQDYQSSIDTLRPEGFIKSIGLPKAYNLQRNQNQKIFETKINKIDEFKRLQKALKEFCPISIDTFLRDNPSFEEPGKAMILYSLLKRESEARFHLRKPQHKNETVDNWYTLLLNDILSSCADNPKKLLENNLKIISFNYDVSLDYFLSSRLKETEVYKSKTATGQSIADEFVKTTQINHVYGRMYDPNVVDYEKYSDDSRDKNSPYSQSGPDSRTFQNFKRLAFSIIKFKNIKTMYGERQEKEAKENAEILQWANDIVIIGFGFDRDNLDLLGFPNSLNLYLRTFANKTIRWLNYSGNMTSLSKEFQLMATMSESNKLNEIKIIESTSTSISNAYQNDFKKSLYLE